MPSVSRSFEALYTLCKTDQVLFDSHPATADIGSYRPDIVFQDIQPPLDLLKMTGHHRLAMIQPTFQFIEQNHRVRQRWQM